MEKTDRQYFDEIALNWDNLRKKAFSEGLREEALSVAMVQSGKLAADIGVGTGFIAEGLIGRGLKVVAIDQSAAMLHVMKQKVRDAAAVEYCMGHAEDLPVRDGAVDYVFANMCLHHLAQPSAAIREMARIMRVGGRLTITDLDAHDVAFLQRERHDRWLGFTPEDLTRWFVEARLTNVAVRRASELCSVRSARGNECASIGILIASGDRMS